MSVEYFKALPAPALAQPHVQPQVAYLGLQPPVLPSAQQHVVCLEVAVDHHWVLLVEERHPPADIQQQPEALSE